MTDTEMGVWLPIESAPRDGTPVLVYNRAWCVGMYCHYNLNEGGEAVSKTAWGCATCHWAHPFVVQPTHWMRLPEITPAISQGDKK